MDDLTPPEYVTRADGSRLAFRRVKGRAPTLVFLPGYKSDMSGAKALALGAFAIKTDYHGCGESDGTFEDGTLGGWAGDAQLVIEQVVRGPLVLVGSSMGGWIMLLLALALGSDVKGLVGIAAAPDFTDWGFSSQDKGIIEKTGRLETPWDYAPEPRVTTRAFWRSGQENLLLKSEIGLTCPVRLLQGQCDDDVPWQTALTLAERLRSADVQVRLIKDGDHRLSRDADLQILVATVAELLESL
jgi:pimeloyl-ACP methyl ester carboxylesterase